MANKQSFCSLGQKNCFINFLVVLFVSLTSYSQTSVASNSLKTFMASLLNDDENIKISELSKESAQNDANFAAQHYSLNAESSLSNPNVENFPDRSRPRWSLGTTNTLPLGFNLSYELSRNLNSSSAEQEQSMGIGLNVWPNLLGRLDNKNAAVSRHFEKSQTAEHEKLTLETCKEIQSTYATLLRDLLKLKIAKNKEEQSLTVFKQLRSKYNRKQIREIDFRGAEIDFASDQASHLQAEELVEKHIDRLEAFPAANKIAQELKLEIEKLNEEQTSSFLKKQLVLEAVNLAAPSWDSHPIIRSADENIEAYEAQHQARRLELSPKFDLSYARSEGDITSLVPKQNNYGATLSWNFWSPNKNSIASRAKIQNLKAKASKILVLRQLKQNWSTQNRAFMMQTQSLKLLENQSQSAQRQLKLALSDLNYGRISIESYLNFRTSYWHIRENIVNLQAEHFLTRNEILYLGAMKNELCLL